MNFVSFKLKQTSTINQICAEKNKKEALAKQKKN
jgi:hypothetical protein